MTAPARLVVWLREAMDAAWRDAEAAGGDDWRRQDHLSDTVAIYDSKGGPVVYDEGWPTEAQQAHIVRHSPAAVLRRITADRKTLDEHAENPYSLGSCRTCTVREDGWAVPIPADFPCTTVRLLAEGWGWTEETTS